MSGAPALYDTRATVIWDATALYIGFWIEEPLVQAYQTERDSLVFLDNDVEVFIDGGDTYYELEINSNRPKGSCMRHTSDATAVDHVALAILRHQDRVVLVQQQAPNDSQPYSVLRGGLVEPCLTFKLSNVLTF